jgi:hypothetical protein
LWRIAGSSNLFACFPTVTTVHLLRKTRNLRQVRKQPGRAGPAVAANLYAAVSFEDMQAGVTGPCGLNAGT